MVRAVLAIIALALGVAAPANAVVFDLPEQHRAIVQGQVFLGGGVSRVSDGVGEACMVSTGTDWKETAEARRAASVAAYLASGDSVETAFELTSPVPIEDLSSNTPYLAFVFEPGGTAFARIATGFAIAYDSLELRLDGAEPEVFSALASIEPRGDTAVVRAPKAVASLFEAAASGRKITVSARSSKQDSAQEHHIRYRFVAQNWSQERLNGCLEQIAMPGNDLNTGASVGFSLVPDAQASGHLRLTLRGMACNRDLDPNGATLMALDGPVTGFASPLSHALVRFAEDGAVEHAWSGDLWRLSRIGSGYQLSVSNSVLVQSPMGEQEMKACTRYALPRCATVSMVGERLTVGGCFASYVSAIGLPKPPIVPDQRNRQILKAPNSIVLASSGGSGPPTLVRTTVSTQTVVNGPPSATPTSPQQAPSGSSDLSSIPIPPSGLLMLFLMPLAIAAHRRARRPM